MTSCSPALFSTVQTSTVSSASDETIRVVHGGLRHVQPELVDGNLLESLAALTPLAPNHNPAALAVITAVGEALPGVPRAACFDTAFHATQPRLHTTMPLPASWRDRGVRRYGFHGLSFESIARQLPTLLGAQADGRIIVAHLGSGASVCGSQLPPVEGSATESEVTAEQPLASMATATSPSTRTTTRWRSTAKISSTSLTSSAGIDSRCSATRWAG